MYQIVEVILGALPTFEYKGVSSIAKGTGLTSETVQRYLELILLINENPKIGFVNVEGERKYRRII